MSGVWLVATARERLPSGIPAFTCYSGMLGGRPRERTYVERVEPANKQDVVLERDQLSYQEVADNECAVEAGSSDHHRQGETHAAKAGPHVHLSRHDELVNVSEPLTS